MVKNYIPLFFGILTGFLLSFSTVRGQSKPNIIIYLTDDQSQADASVYGASNLLTPQLERLSDIGMTFENAFIASPACAPSRAALLTGLMPARNGAEANHTYPRPGTLLLTQKLQDIGYEVLALGKVAHGKMNQESGFDAYQPVPKWGDLSGAARLILESRNNNRPICLLLGDHRPHVAWIDSLGYNPQEVSLPDYLINTLETREHWARYYTDITGADREMGEVLDLAQEKWNDDFIFIYSSDHGGQWPFGKWNLYDAGIKVPLLVAWPGQVESGSRTDAMVSWIDIFPTLLDMLGGEVPKDIDGKSFAPVLLGETDQHRDMIFTTHSGDGVMNVYPIRSVRTQRYKYIINLCPECYHTNHSDILRKDGAGAYWDSWDKKAETDSEAAAIIQKYYVRPAEEFYDLQQDPTEQHNLIEEANYQTQIKTMRSQLEEWMQQQGDHQTVFQKPYLISDPKPDSVLVLERRNKN
ncbi:MAG: sulfatase [Bacteroidota bacterium]